MVGERQCPHCHVAMTDIGTYRFDVTREDVKSVGEFLRSVLFARVYKCPECGKIELFSVQ